MMLKKYRIQNYLKTNEIRALIKLHFNAIRFLEIFNLKKV